MANNEIYELADKLKALREEKAELERNLKELNDAITDVEARMIELMADDELQSFNRAGNLFYLSVAQYPSAVPEKKDMLYSILKDKGYGHLFTINQRTLAASVKEMMEENGGRLPEWLEGLIRVYEKCSIGIRKAK